MGAIHDKCVDVPSRGVHKAVMIVLDKMEGFRRKAMGLEQNVFQFFSFQSLESNLIAA